MGRRETLGTRLIGACFVCPSFLCHHCLVRLFVTDCEEIPSVSSDLGVFSVCGECYTVIEQ